MSEQAGCASAVLTRYEAAALLGLSTKTLDRLRAAGAIPALQISKRLVRYLQEDLDAYRAGCRVRIAQKVRPAAEPQIDHSAAMRRARLIVANQRGREAVLKMRRSATPAVA